MNENDSCIEDKPYAWVLLYKGKPLNRPYYKEGTAKSVKTQRVKYGWGFKEEDFCIIPLYTS